MVYATVLQSEEYTCNDIIHKFWFPRNMEEYLKIFETDTEAPQFNLLYY